MYQSYVTSKVQRTGTGPYCGSSQTYSDHDLLPHRKGWSNEYVTGRGVAVTYYLLGRCRVVLVIDRVSDSLSLLMAKMFF